MLRSTQHARSGILWVSILFFRSWGRPLDGDDFKILHSSLTNSWSEFIVPYAGYLIFFQRSAVVIASRISLTNFALVGYFISISIWALTAYVIQISFEKCFGSFRSGFIAALCFVLLPISNFLLVGSIVGAHAPLVILICVVVCTKTYPSSKISKLLFLLFCVFISLSYPLTWLLGLVPIASFVVLRTRLLRYERQIVASLLMGGFIQVFTYSLNSADAYMTISARVSPPTLNFFIYKVRWMAHSVLPPPFRSAFISGLSAQQGVFIIFLFFMILLSISIIVLRRRDFRNNQDNQEVWFRLLTAGVVLTFATFALSKILNYHYILLGCFVFYIFVAFGLLELWKLRKILKIYERLVLIIVAMVLVAGSLTSFRPPHGDRYFWHNIKFANGFTSWRSDVRVARLYCLFGSAEEVTVPPVNPVDPFLFPCEELEKRVKLTPFP